MDNIVGYICSTPWGTVSRTTPSLGWTPVLPAIPDGWQDAGTGAFPHPLSQDAARGAGGRPRPRHGARTLEPLLGPHQPELGDAAGSRR